MRFFLIARITTWDVGIAVVVIEKEYLSGVHRQLQSVPRSGWTTKPRVAQRTLGIE
jgi:hypothetical protein